MGGRTWHRQEQFIEYVPNNIRTVQGTSAFCVAVFNVYSLLWQWGDIIICYSHSTIISFSNLHCVYTMWCHFCVSNLMLCGQLSFLHWECCVVLKYHQQYPLSFGFYVIWSNLFSSVCSAMCLTVLRLHSSMCYAKNPVGYNLMQHSKCSVHFGHHILWTCSSLCSIRECLMTNWLVTFIWFYFHFNITNTYFISMLLMGTILGSVTLVFFR